MEGSFVREGHLVFGKLPSHRYIMPFPQKVGISASVSEKRLQYSNKVQGQRWEFIGRIFSLTKWKLQYFTSESRAQQKYIPSLSLH